MPWATRTCSRRSRCAARITRPVVSGRSTSTGSFGKRAAAQGKSPLSMCGIAGFVNLDGAPADSSVLAAMTDMIRHRGPDDRGTLRVSLRGGIPDTALGFHRLKILDVSSRGHQPMTSQDGAVALLFNGE